LRASRRMKARRPERFPAKWRPVRVKKTRQNKNLEPRFDSIEAEKALENELERFPRGADQPISLARSDISIAWMSLSRHRSPCN
jgi:hypothetical protein